MVLNDKCVTVVASTGLHFRGISFLNIRSQSRLEGKQYKVVLVNVEYS